MSIEDPTIDEDKALWDIYFAVILLLICGFILILPTLQKWDEESKEVQDWGGVQRE